MWGAQDRPAPRLAAGGSETMIPWGDVILDLGPHTAGSEITMAEVIVILKGTGHVHTCPGCGDTTNIGAFDCEQNTDHDYELCDACVAAGVTL